MSTCREVRSLLLEAEPDALAGIGTSAVAEHVRECGACAAAAAAVLDETEALERFLAGAAPPPDVDAILAEAGAAHVAPGG